MSMKGSIEIKPNGDIVLSINEGSTFDEGAKRILELQAMLGAAGVPIELSGPIEQHRHDDQTVYNAEHINDGTSHHH